MERNRNEGSWTNSGHKVATGNKVMHPVRPLVHSQKDVAALLRQVERLADFRQSLRHALNSMPDTPLL